MIDQFVSWTLGILGLARISEIAREQDFETTLAMLLPREQERESFRQGVLTLAKAGLTGDDMERAARMLARGHTLEAETDAR